MAGDSKMRLDKVLADCFGHHAEGHALYAAVSAEILKPGCCGYMDKDGRWTPIVQLTEPEELKTRGFSASAFNNANIKTNPISEYWGEVKSSNVKGKFINASGEATDPNTQAFSAGASVSYSTHDGAGAIFITNGDVTEKYLEDAWLADRWMEENGPKIADTIRPTRDRGVWIVTRTFAAPERCVAVLEENDQEASLSVNADVYKAGKVQAAAVWWDSYNGSMWKHAEHKDGVVLFMAGINYKPKLWGKGFNPEDQPKKEKLLGKRPMEPIDVKFTDEEDAGRVRYMQFVPEQVGKLREKEDDNGGNDEEFDEYQ